MLRGAINQYSDLETHSTWTRDILEKHPSLSTRLMDKQMK